MTLIVDERGSGKTKRLLAAAMEQGAVVVTLNPQALRVKAHGYGFSGVEICGLDDVPCGRKVMFHNLDRIVAATYDVEFAGGTLTND